MKLSPAEQEQITRLLTRIYHDILEIETRYSLAVGGGDYRARIEYFHDAVRAFTSEQPVAMDGSSRLNIEWLAYDVQALRYIQSMPLSPFEPHHHSPATALVTKKKGALTPKRERPDRATKERLIELYQNYAVLFAALLKPFADNDYHVRTDAAHQDVTTIHALIERFEKGGKIGDIVETIHHLEDDALRYQLEQFLQSEQYKNKPAVKKLLAGLKGEIKKKNKEIGSIDKAHMEYGLAQLGLYEAAKDNIKKMAASGMNLAGKFVENAMAETRREIGR